MLETHGYEATGGPVGWGSRDTTAYTRLLVKYPAISAQPIKEKDKVPTYIKALSPKIVRTRRLYIEMGCCLALSGWSRRAIPNELQLGMACFSEIGGQYLDHEGNVLPVHEDILDEVLGDDPGYKWLSAWPRRALNGLVRQTPHKRLLKRLTLFNLAMRTPLIELPE
jgi:hypothetical protein